MAFSATAVTSVQAQLAGFGDGKLVQILGAIDVLGGPIVNSSGVITIGGRALTNAQYYQLYEMIEPMF